MNPTGPGDLQFQRAEFETTSRQCQVCKTGGISSYYLLGSATLCTSCAMQYRGSHTSPGLLKPILAGLVVAIACGLVLSFIPIQWSLLTILVGAAIAKTMLFVTGGIGGRTLQIAAVLLTYAAATLGPAFSLLRAVEFRPAPTEQSVSSKTNTPPANPPVLTPQLRLRLYTQVVRYALLSPFLEIGENPFGGLLTLLIIFFGLAQAWRMTRDVSASLTGPFEAPAGASA